ncbi:helix-turn-helix domain-containing protein [Methylocapsa sp. S129]|uniref:helix-turn-helix domain-containing protein n=1 Tax=Methylocapsa sp. S129 TaxID=1641869 RepID=UPI00131CB7CF|nr:AraC family transcriptional regulator [Methylocapsa sp. S129]
MKLSSSGFEHSALRRQPVAQSNSTLTERLGPDTFAEHFWRSCPFQQEHRMAGSLALFRAPRRLADHFSTPPVKGISIRMNRSRRDGSKIVDYGAGRIRSSLDRHYNVAPANLVSSCELSSEVDFLALEFSPDAFKEHLGDRSDLGRLHAECQRDELVMQLVERIWQESAEGITRLEADGLSIALVTLLVRASRSDFQRPDGPRALNNRQLNRLFEYVESHLADDLSVVDLGRAIGCSTTEITSSLRAATGTSPWQFVLLRRLERAKSLLASSQHAMSEIALECGFSSSQHFATAFKKQLGTTPGAYRRDWKS